MAIAAPRWGTDRDENGVRLDHRLFKVGSEFEPALARIGLDHAVEARFIDRDFVALQGGDLGGILVDANDVMTEIRKARARDEANITRPDHGNPHTHSSKSSAPTARHPPSTSSKRSHGFAALRLASIHLTRNRMRSLPKVASGRERIDAALLNPRGPPMTLRNMRDHDVTSSLNQ